MNWAQVNRIAWKDMRRMGPLWLCLVGFWMLCGAYSTWQWTRGNFAFPFPRQEFAVLLVPFMAIIYAMAWSGVTFASEHEDNTYSFLRALPVDAKHVFYGKMLYGVNSTLLLAVVLALICAASRWFLSARGLEVDNIGISPQATGLRQLGWGLAAIVPLTLVTGVFWSLKSRPLWALVLGALTTICLVAFVCIAVQLIAGNASATEGNQTKFALAICAGLGVLAVGILFVDRHVVKAWMPNRSESPLFQHAALEIPAIPQTKFGGGFRRLMWMQLRHGVVRTALIGVAGFWLALIGFNLSGPLPVMAIGLLGVFVFRPEHESKRFRFLSQVGVRPLSYWFSRILFPIAVAVVIAACFSANPVLWNQAAQYPYMGGEFLFFGCIATFCIAQLVSIACSSTIVGIAVTLACSTAAWVWLYACTLPGAQLYAGYHGSTLDIRFYMSVCAMLGFPLLASYLRVSRWFQETGSWRQWVVPALPIGCLVIGLPLSIALWRVYEIPGVELQPAFASFNASVPENDGTRAYREVLLELPNSPISFSMEENLDISYFKEWLADAPAIVEELADAIAQGGPIPEENRMGLYVGQGYYDGQDHEGVAPVMIAATCLLHAAEDAVKNDDPQTAWEHYRSALEMARHLNDGKANYGTKVHAHQIENAIYRRLVNWAMARGNTPEAVQAAAIYIDEYRAGDPPPENAVLAYYHQLDTALKDGISLPSLDGEDHTQEAALVSALMPWEAIRSRRFLNYAFSREYERATGRGYALTQPTHFSLEAVYASTTLGGEHMKIGGSSGVHSQQNSQRSRVIAQLALLAHNMEFGEYPDSLSKVRLDGQKLSDDFESYNFVRYGHRDLPAPCLTTNTGNVLLPDEDFSLWTTNQFAERQQALIPETESGMHMSGFEFDPYGGGEGMGGMVSSDETPAALFAILSQLENVPSKQNVPKDLLQNEIKRRLGEGTDEEKMVLMTAIFGHHRVEMFATELLRLLDGDNLELAGQAARIFELLPADDFHSSQLGTSAESDASIKMIAERASKPPTELGTYSFPIRNPKNGHYYEVVGFDYAGTYIDPDLEDYELEENWRCTRTFRGIKGKLAGRNADKELIQSAFPELERVEYWLPNREFYELARTEVLIEYVVEETD